MASCEKCWRDAGGNFDLYQNLVGVRNCTPEEQSGEESTICKECGRKTIHVYTHTCTACGIHKEAE